MSFPSPYQTAQALQLKLTMRHHEFDFALLGAPNDRADRVKIEVRQAGRKILSCYISELYKGEVLSLQELERRSRKTLWDVERFLFSIQGKVPTLLPLLKTAQTKPQKRHIADSLTSPNDFSGLAALQIDSELFIVLVWDSEEQIHYPTLEQVRFDFPQLSLEEIYQISRQNLIDDLLPLLQLDRSLPFGVSLQLDSHYDASMLLIFDHWHQQLHFNGPPVIGLFADDSIILVDSTQPGHIKALQQLADQNLHASTTAAKNLYTIQQGRLQVYPRPPVPHR